MKLYIDTSDSEEMVVKLDEESFVEKAKKEKSQRLLPLIDEILKKKKKTLKDLTEIVVVEGPGSFTGLRVGLSVANTIGWDLNIPVNGKNIRKDGPVSPKYS